MEQKKQDKSLGELFSQLTGETTNLVRQEVQLAKTEMLQKAATWGKGAVFIAIAGVFALLAAFSLLAAAISALGTLIGVPWAALAIGVVLLVLAGILALTALKSLKSAGVAPQQSLESLREDAQWAKEQIP